MKNKYTEIETSYLIVTVEHKVIDGVDYWRFPRQTHPDNDMLGGNYTAIVETPYISKSIKRLKKNDYWSDKKLMDRSIICTGCNTLNPKFEHDEGIDWGSDTCKNCGRVWCLRGYSTFMDICKYIDGVPIKKGDFGDLKKCTLVED